MEKVLLEERVKVFEILFQCRLRGEKLNCRFNWLNSTMDFFLVAPPGPLSTPHGVSKFSWFTKPLHHSSPSMPTDILAFPPANESFDFHTVRKAGTWKRQRLLQFDQQASCSIENRFALSAALAWVFCTSSSLGHVETVPTSGCG
ncbi:hypothetical protein MG293_001646 [Ovis ammon polii]|uniref:Uncharacterized protein n=1 Tax=Ovis ammon polii TaxID=230172 RepID=A0AAD4UPW7_OVIAM|nr:hypothetical protein MG293_001646 [Ovis ammon polii]